MKFYNMLNEKEEKVLKLIQADKNQCNYFFGKAKDLKWFYPLKENGFFLPEKIPYDQHGNSLFWNILPYLERISSQVGNDDEWGRELLSFIRAITNYSANTKKINNEYTWWSCAKILNHISPSIIKENISLDDFRGLLKEWLSDGSKAGMVLRELGESLLSNFLNEDFRPNYEYAIIIVDALTDIHPGKRKRALRDDPDAELKFESYWVSDAFEKNGEDLAIKCQKAVFTVANKLRDTLTFNRSYINSTIIGDNTAYELRIERIRAGNLNDNQIRFKTGSYLFRIDQYSPSQLNGIDLSQGIWGLMGKDPELVILDNVPIAAHSKDEFIVSIKKNLPAHIKWDSIENLESKIEYLFDGMFEDYSQVWLKSLEFGGDRYQTQANEILTSILRSLLLKRAEITQNHCRDVIETFLTEEYPFPIFQRFALYFINKYWDNGFSDLFDKFITQYPQSFQNTSLEIELYDVLKQHNLKFSDDLKIKIRALINQIPKYYLEHEEQLVSYWKFKWLSPLKDNPDFKAEYVDAKTKAEVKQEEEYKPDRNPIKAAIINPKAPIAKEDLVRLHAKGTLCLEFNNYKYDDKRAFFNDAPTREGLGNLFKQAIADQPTLFLEKIEQYLEAPPYYIHHLLWSFRDVLKTKRDLPLKGLIDFFSAYIEKNKNLVSDTTVTNEDDDTVQREFFWVIEWIASIIEDLANADLLEREWFKNINEIFDLISSFIVGKDTPDTQRDIINYSLNTTLGKVSRAEILFALRIARDSKSGLPNWGNEKYERYLAKGVEPFAWFGHYLPQVRYLDKDYAENKILQFSQLSSDDHKWQAFMEGYLLSGSVYNQIYQIPAMRENYVKAIKGNIFDKRDEGRLVHHITIAYLSGLESLDKTNQNGNESLFWSLLHQPSHPEQFNRWSAVTNYFWSISPRSLKESLKREEQEESSIQKILDFWKWSYQNRGTIRENLKDKYNEFLGGLTDLTIYLDKIDSETEEWLRHSIPFVGYQHRSSFFIEYLTKFVSDNESMKFVGKIFCEMLKTNLPTYKKEDIIEIVEGLYEIESMKKTANEICNIYGRHGEHFLKNLFNKYNSQH